jgi:hydroxyacylglutathione hydrolase
VPESYEQWVCEEIMIFEIIVVGPLAVNCFLLGDEASRDGIVVDPGGDAARVLAAVKNHGLTISRVINTHGHFDHIGANRQVLAATGAELLIHREDIPFLTRAADVATMYGLSTENSPPADRFLEDGMVIVLGDTEIKVLHTPGHTPGGCCLYLQTEGKVITGDTLFAEGVGRTDFPGSSHEALMASIRTKLMTLPDATSAYPGHGPATTIGHERRYNPYIQS